MLMSISMLNAPFYLNKCLKGAGRVASIAAKAMFSTMLKSGTLSELQCHFLAFLPESPPRLTKTQRRIISYTQGCNLTENERFSKTYFSFSLLMPLKCYD